MLVLDGGRVIRRRRAGGKGKDDLKSPRKWKQLCLETMVAFFLLSFSFLSLGFAGIGGCFATWTLVT